LRDGAEQVGGRREVATEAGVEELSASGAAGGDRRQLRGVSIIGGVGGVIAGTDPMGALLAKEQRRRR